MTLLERAKAAGSDRQFIDWISFQPSVLDGNFTQWQGGQGRNIPCHVRRIGNGAGMGYKPQYSAVPMTGAQHRIQSLEGEAAVIFKYLGYRLKAEEAKLWFDTKRNEVLSKWVDFMGDKK